VAAEVEQAVEGSSLPYENAQALYHLSAGYLAVGDEVTSARYCQQVEAIAKARGYYELQHQVERAELARAARLAAQRELGSASRRVVTTLETFEPEAEAFAFATTRAG